MNTNRFWIEIVAVGTAIAFALALLIATLGAAAATVGGQDETGQVNGAAEQQKAYQQKTYQGMVTCSRCRAKHSATLGRTASNCVLICVHGGASFALVDGDKTYLLDGDLGVLKKVAGQRAEIIGTASGNTITVSSAAEVI
jgi:hypothetical protein